MDQTSQRPVKVALVILCGLAVITALEFAQSILAPIVSAVVIGVVLSPLTDWLVKRGFHPAAAALTVLFLFLSAAAALVLALEPTLSSAIAQAPIIWSEFQGVVDLARGAISGIQDIQDTMSDVLVDEANAATDEGAPAEANLPIPSVFDALSYGPALLGGMLVFVGTLYFFLASRSNLYGQIARAFSSVRVSTLHDAERQVSRYFLTITCINAGFGTLVTLAMMLLGVPQPVLWGIATFLLNYLLYLGPAMVAVSLLIVGVVTFDGALSFAPVAIFIGFNMIEAQFATPTLVGQHMSLNPLLVFLSLVGWLWLWGPIGGLVAIPLLVWILFMLDKDQTLSSA
ncbi:AI-2E family transporter [Gymnodinialimonas sp. 2305UL16-5]|uniref:AI-2E family transporter n=1 Tax=Gymnodinialimonas mytili TaxID=3126503 RepID=UPI0030AA8116